MDVFNLTVRQGFPVTYQGTKFGKVFNAGVQLQRPGLLLLDGKIYAAFASFCDIGSFRGWIFKFDAKTGNIDNIFLTTGNSGGVGAGIWQSGVGLSSDRSGRLFGVTGNAAGGNFDNPIPGNTPPQVLGNTAFRLNTTTMLVEDFFTPFNEEFLDTVDLDLGTSGNLKHSSMKYFL